jgi:hypothetical protein
LFNVPAEPFTNHHAAGSKLKKAIEYSPITFDLLTLIHCVYFSTSLMLLPL